MFSKSTFTLRSDPGAKDLLLSIREAEATRDENPVWLRNRPRGWKRSRDRLYFEALGLAWGLLILVVLAITIGGFNPSLPILLFVSTFLTIAMCYAAFALIHSFDFLGGRQWVLEDVWMTRLAVSDIVYGSYQSGIGASAAVLFPLLAGECCLWFRAGVWEGLLCMFLLAPTQWVTTCYAIQYSLSARTTFRPVDSALLVGLPVACILRVAVWLAIAAVAFLVAATLFSSFEADLVLLLYFIAIPVYAVVSSHWGYRVLDRSWIVAVNNIRARRNQ